MSKKIKIFLIAGEASGDILGGKLMQALKKRAALSKICLEFYGIGGSAMLTEGLNLIYPMKNIGIIGLFEIIPYLFKLLSIIRYTARYIDELHPDIMITIDAWDFCSRVVDRIKSRLNIKLVHYISPTVWAYRKARANKLAELYDLILSIFPFESQYYKDIDIEYQYIGHPLIESFLQSNNNSCNRSFKDKYKLQNQKKILGVMAGSRKREVQKMLPIFIESINKFLSQIKNRQEFMVVFPAINSGIAKKIASLELHMNFKYLIINVSEMQEYERINMLKEFDLALVKSGTSSLELTFAKVPMLVAYKINYLSELIARHIFKINKNLNHVSMTNIILKDEVIEEFLQHRCNSQAIANGLKKLLDPSYRKKQLSKYSKLASTLRQDKDPSDIAAEAVLKSIL